MKNISSNLFFFLLIFFFQNQNMYYGTNHWNELDTTTTALLCLLFLHGIHDWICHGQFFGALFDHPCNTRLLAWELQVYFLLSLAGQLHLPRGQLLKVVGLRVKAVAQCVRLTMLSKRWCSFIILLLLPRPKSSSNL
jgi:hypothetical protein